MEEELLKGSDLVIGQRYWMDKLKDISGVLSSREFRNGYDSIGFTELEGNYAYLLDDNGVVWFPEATGNYSIAP